MCALRPCGRAPGARLGQRHCAQQRLRLQRAAARAARETMTGDGDEHRLHVLRHHHRPTRHQRPSARRGEQHQAGARRQPAARAGVGAAGAAGKTARRREQRLHVVEKRGRDVDVTGVALPFGQRRGVGDRRDVGDARAAVAAGEELAIGGGVRVAELDGHQEAVELRFRQRIRADLLHRILRGDDEERLGQLARLAVDRHLALLHRLEQCALRLRRRAIDLVGEHHRVEDRARQEAERLRALVVDRYAEDIRGQEVARELHARVAQAERRRQRLRQRRLADARNVLNQQVAAREHARHRQAQRLVLADDDARELCQRAGDALRDGGGLLGGADGHRGGRRTQKMRHFSRSRAAASPPSGAG